MAGLIPFRHGKSDWDAAYPGGDAARPLARRGRKAAKTMGRFLARAGQVPDAAITSPAVRAHDTLRLAMDGGDWTCPARTAPSLYGGGVADLLAEIRNWPATTEVLLAVGHEPTWSEAVSAFIGGGAGRLPAAAVGRIGFDVDGWGEGGPGTRVLVGGGVARPPAGGGEPPAGGAGGG